MMGSYVTCASRWMMSISRNAFATLSDPRARLKRSRDLSFGARQGELKHGAARLVRRRPQLAAVSMDDGPAYRQPHACSTGLRGVEGVEDPIEMRRINSRSGIPDCHEDTSCLVLLGTDDQLSYPYLGCANCFSRIQNQFKQDLLQLNAIPQNRKESIRKPGLHRNAIPVGRA